MGSEDQSLTVQSKKSRSSHHISKYSHQRNNSRKPRDMYNYICYTCGERGHFSRDCPRNKNGSHKKGDKKIHHDHAPEDDDPSKKRIKQDSGDSLSDEEYVLIFALTGTITDLKTRSLLLYDVNMNCTKSMNEAHKSIIREPNSIDNTHIKTTS